MKKIQITGKYRMVMIAACGLAANAVGVVLNTPGIFTIPIAETFHMSISAVSFSMTLAMMVSALGGLAIPKLFRSDNFKMMVLISAVLTCGGSVCLALSNTIWMIYLFNILRGFGSGMTGFVLCSWMINNWFHTGNGMLNSIAMGLSGITGTLMSPLFSMVIQSFGWRAAFMVSAVVQVILVLPALTFPISLSPSVYGLEPLGDDKSQNREQARAYHDRSVLVFLMVLGICAAGNMTNALVQHLPGLAAEFSANTAIGAALLSICMVANIVSKVALGTMIDRFGCRKSVMEITLVTFAGAVILRCFHGEIAMLTGAFCFGFTFAAPSVGAAMISLDIFGPEDYSRKYPIIAFAGTAANSIALTIAGSLYDFTNTYKTMMTFALFILISLELMVIFAYHLKQSHEKKGNSKYGTCI